MDEQFERNRMGYYSWEKFQDLQNTINIKFEIIVNHANRTTQQKN